MQKQEEPQIRPQSLAWASGESVMLLKTGNVFGGKEVSLLSDMLLLTFLGCFLPESPGDV